MICSATTHGHKCCSISIALQASKSVHMSGMLTASISAMQVRKPSEAYTHGQCSDAQCPDMCTFKIRGDTFHHERMQNATELGLAESCRAEFVNLTRCGRLVELEPYIYCGCLSPDCLKTSQSRTCKLLLVMPRASASAVAFN